MKFKVGDWVTKEGSLPFCLEEWNFEWKNSTYFNRLQLWQPKVGEWCWFHNVLQPRLSKYKQTRAVQGKNIYVDCYGDEFTSCEPFIGELPNLIKDK